jgi:hypothetical protein
MAAFRNGQAVSRSETEHEKWKRELRERREPDNKKWHEGIEKAKKKSEQIKRQEVIKVTERIAQNGGGILPVFQQLMTSNEEHAADKKIQTTMASNLGKGPASRLGFPTENAQKTSWKSDPGFFIGDQFS